MNNAFRMRTVGGATGPAIVGGKIQKTSNGVSLRPTITSSAASRTLSRGDNFAYQIIASNYPTSFKVTGLPAGLTYDSNGYISGTIESFFGAFTVTIMATNSVGTGTKTFTIMVVRK